MNIQTEDGIVSCKGGEYTEFIKYENIHLMNQRRERSQELKTGDEVYVTFNDGCGFYRMKSVVTRIEGLYVKHKYKREYVHINDIDRIKRIDSIES